MGKKIWLRSLSLLVMLLTLLPLNARSAAEAQAPQPQIVQPPQKGQNTLTARLTPATPLAPPPIRLVIGSFTPSLGETLDVPPDLRAGFSATQPKDGYYLVQFKGPIEEGWKAAVRDLGGLLFDYVPDFTFIVYLKAPTVARVQALPEVLWVGPYEPAYKLSPDLAGQVGMLDLNVQTFPNVSRSSLTSTFEALGIGIKEVSEQSTGTLFRMTVEAAQLQALARVPAVRWIEPFYERVLFNDVARSDLIMDAETIWADLGLYGAGQVVAVTDTGLDTGSLATLHQDFRGNPTGCANTNRVVATFALGRPPSNWSDSCGTSSGGHGTHVTGSVLGNGCMSGSSGIPNYGTSYAGLAPQASLVFQSVMDSACSLGGLPDDLNTLYSQADTAGAHIHTNSWGAAVSGQYTTDSQNTDLYVWNHKDYVILFAAGNEGVDTNPRNGYVDADSMSAPGTAKNCITVGASENYRPSPFNSGSWGAYWPTDFPNEPIKSDPTANNANGMAAFSSRGPTDDGRIKPDVVAPGSYIASTKSQAPTGVGSGWGNINTYYQYMGGTSMATPLTAGGVALVREFYTDIEGVTPSAALVKATLINSAVDIYPGQYASPLEQDPRLPNNAQGWGRVNIANATDSTHVYEDISDANGLATGGNHTYTYNNCSAGVFKVTLVWSDYPGSTLVNDLDLTVTAPGGSTTYYGNVFSNGWSAVGGSVDHVNNVESVYINAPTAGTWTVRVSGYNVPQGASGKQGYALVVDMPDNVCDPDFTLGVTPTSLDICQGATATYDVALGSIAHFNSPVSLSASGNPGTVNFSPNPATPPDNGSTNSTLSLTGAAAGAYAFDVIGTSGALTHQQTVNLNVQAGAPGTASLIAPANGSINVPRAVTFSWAATAGASTYTLQIATSPDFVQNLQEVTGLTATSYDITLVADTVYYWRVRAVNPCGTGAFATSAAFRTEAVTCPVYGPGTAGAILDAQNSTTPRTTTFNLSVPDAGAIIDLDVVSLAGTHTYVGDLSFALVSPASTQVTLIPRMCTSADNFSKTLDDEAASALACPLADGATQRPQQALSAFDGQSRNGTWALRITDSARDDTGTLSGWYLRICSGAAYNAVCGNLPGSFGMACHRALSGSTLQLGATWGNQDGVTFDRFVKGRTNPITVNVQGAPQNSRYLRVWFDWDNNGVFDGTDLAYQGVAVDGDNAINISVPADLAEAVPYRVRLYDGQPVTLLSQDSRSFGDTDGGDIADGTSPTPVPTAILLASFTALAEGENIRIAWDTAAELQNLGFNLYRGESITGPWTQLNAALIPTQNPGATFGASYTWLDTGVTPEVTYFYRLEDISTGGASTFHGPVSATAAGVTSVVITDFGANRVAPAALLLTLATAAALAGQRKRRRTA